SALALEAVRSGRWRRRLRPALLGLTVVELALFGFGFNPAIERRYHDDEPPVITRLREGLAPGSRVLGVGEELPPNVLMRFGLAAARNYDSVELERSVAWLDPVFVPSPAARSSRRDVSWASAIGQIDRLSESSVGAIMGATPPPPGAFARVERAGRVWIA